jgi:Zn-dependent protease
MFDFDIARMIQNLALIAPGFLLAITVHEYTHGYVAYRLGDPTAKLAGRLTFNPISHLDLFGTLVLVLTQMIGWAKPVPVDPRYLHNPRKDML